MLTVIHHPTARRTPRAVRALAVSLAVALSSAACAPLVGNAPLSAEERGLAYTGPADGEVLNADALAAATFTVTASGEGMLDDVALTLDGEDVTDAVEVDAATHALSYTPGELDDGDRILELIVAPEVEEADGAGGTDDAASEKAEPPVVLHTWEFTVDTTPPDLEVDERDGPAIAGQEVTVTGTSEPGATVAVGSAEATADDTGAFELVLPTPPSEPAPVVATDAAGNATTSEVGAIVTVPSRVELDEFQAVHVSFYGWKSSLKPNIVQMVQDRRFTAVQLDLKDESGRIAYTSEVPLAVESGASLGIWDLREAVEEIHAMGAPVIGRIVAFADPSLVSWAWANGRRDMVIQTPDGSAPFTGKYAGFSNFTHPDVIAYNIAIAKEAAAAGVDHILWDYIRRPDGGLSKFRVPGLVTTPEEAVVAFTKMADEALAPYGVQHGASVYGIAADRPTQIGQYIPGMAEYLDYVAPMIYPSHWGPGEYGVSDPNRQPYDIITATLEVWKEVTEGKRARVVPWLEDTSYRAWDRPHQIREQIRATRDAGIDSYLFWDPNVKYTPGAHDPQPAPAG